ncbi:MAG: hypothetical protein ACO3C1_07735 [Ilumatobacteraceae bacterium]
MADDAGKRPFWMHQLVEYILGGGLVAAGVQSPEPVVPAAVGGLLLLYAACTKSSIAAFRLLSRRVHRVGDPVVVLVEAAAAAQPWVAVDVAGRAAIGAVAFVHLVVWWQSTYTERVPRQQRRAAARTAAGAVAPSTAPGEPAGDRATDVGRSLGRAVARGIVAARRRGDGR